MNIENLIKNLKESGIEINLVGENLELYYKNEEIPNYLLQSVRENKNKIISYIKNMIGPTVKGHYHANKTCSGGSKTPAVVA